MEWRNPPNVEPMYQWPPTEEKYWEASQAFPMPLPDLAVTAPLRPARNPSYNYELQPAGFERMLSPAPSPASSDCYLDSRPLRGYIDQNHLAPTSAGMPAVSSNQYDPRCRSPWTNATASPVPTSTFLNPKPVESSTEDEFPSPFSDQDHGALTPASMCDPGSSPWAPSVPLPSSAPETQDDPVPKAREVPTQLRGPCRPRGPASKKRENKDYGTYRCDIEGCTYDRFFSRKGVLKRHIQTQHLNPKAFKCPHPFCDRTSNRKENMKAHRQSVHRETVV